MRTPCLPSPMLLLALVACSERPGQLASALNPDATTIGAAAIEPLSASYDATVLVRRTLGATAPRLDSMVTRVEAALPDSTVRVGTRIVSRDFAPGDTVNYRYFRGDTLLLSKRRVQFADTSQAPAPPYGRTVTYKGCAVIERGGRNSGVKSGSMCWTWAYTRPPLPPTLDSVIRIAQLVLLPATGTVAAREAGASRSADNDLQLCAFAVLSDGRKVKLQNSWNLPGCDAAYKIWVAVGSA
jgi:hypothetical protein